MQETRVWSLDWEDPLKKERLPTPVFWPAEFHGLYSLWSRKESDTIEGLSLFQSYRRVSRITVKLHIPFCNHFGFHFSKMFSFPALTFGGCQEIFVIELCAHRVPSLHVGLLKSFQGIRKIEKLKDHLGQLPSAFVDDVKCLRVATSSVSFFQINQCDFSCCAANVKISPFPCTLLAKSL